MEKPINAKVYTQKAFQRDLKRAHRKAWCREKFQDAKRWCRNNKEMVIIMAPIVVGGVISITKTIVKGVGRGINKSIILAKEDELKNMYCYDRSLGHYWKLRKKPTNNEWLRIDRRKADGERLADILEDMKLLR